MELIEATIDYEIAQDDYAEAEYQLALNALATPRTRRIVREARDRALDAQIDAGIRFLLEADAAGLINLYDPIPAGEDPAVRSAAILTIAAAARGKAVAA
jgi:hypothetical protein